MDTKENQDEIKQIHKLFEGTQEKVTIEEINKHLNNDRKIIEGIISQISKSTYQTWINQKSFDILMLVEIQLYTKYSKQMKEKSQQFQNFVKKFNEDLQKIGKQKVNDATRLKKIIEISNQNIVFVEYKKAKKEQQQQMKSKVQKGDEVTQQKKKSQKVQQTNTVQKQEKLVQQKKIQNQQTKLKKDEQEKKLNAIFSTFLAQQKIQQQNIEYIQQKCGAQCNVTLLKEFKQSQKQKSIDKTSYAFNAQGYTNWYKSKSQPAKNEAEDNKTEQQNKQKPNENPTTQTKDQPESQKNSSQNKQISESPKRAGRVSSGKLLNTLTKYLKKPKTQMKKSVSGVNFEIKYQNQTVPENKIEFSIASQIDQEEIGKLKEEWVKSNIIVNDQGIVYVVLEFLTKKGELVEERLQLLKKQGKIDQKQFTYTTLSEKQRLFVSLSFKNEKYLSQLNKIYQLFKNQCSGKIEIKGSFSIDKDGKAKKIAKCLAKGFNINLEASGSQQFNWRFRKNLQTQNENSLLYKLLALSKKSQISLKLKKIEDINNLFGKLGVLQAANNTHSIQQIIEDLLLQIFEEDIKEAVDIPWLLSQIIGIGQVSKIVITKFNERVLLSASINQGSVISQLFQK